MFVHETFVLSDDHRGFLHRCAISDEVIKSRPHYSLTPESRVHLGARWGLSREALRGEGIVIPRCCPNGDETYPQIRYTPPREDGQKYTCPVGSGGVVDVHPGVTTRSRIPPSRWYLPSRSKELMPCSQPGYWPPGSTVYGDGWSMGVRASS
jgi:hypothetical protein